ncbi:hypothetical protein Ancab_009546 [Ancistrocladus abbreviatus]
MTLVPDGVEVVESPTYSGSLRMHFDSRESQHKTLTHSRSIESLIQRSMCTSFSNQLPLEKLDPEILSLHNRADDDRMPKMVTVSHVSLNQWQMLLEDNSLLPRTLPNFIQESKDILIGKSPQASAEVKFVEAERIDGDGSGYSINYPDQEGKVQHYNGLMWSADRAGMPVPSSPTDNGDESDAEEQEILDKVPEGDWLCEDCKSNEEVENHKHGLSEMLYQVRDLADNAEVAPAAKRQSAKSCLGSSMAAVSRDNSFKNWDKMKAKPGHQLSSGTYSVNDSSETARSPAIGSVYALKGNFSFSAQSAYNCPIAFELLEF